MKPHAVIGVGTEAESGVRIFQESVSDFSGLLGKIGIELRRSTLRTKKRMKRGLLSDTEAIEQATVSVSFNVEVSDTLCGYVCPFHFAITVRAMALTHRTHARRCR